MPTDRPRTSVVPDDAPESTLVVRSPVTPGLPYQEYKETLREDFLWQCAYCTMSEFEAQGIRMTIDHYEPRKARRDLENSYDNLLYACDDCNTLKGDRCPPHSARADGHRFFRPDTDYRHEHFELRADQKEPLLVGKTNTGDFTIQYTDLNRPTLLRLRQLRKRLETCHEHVMHGVLGLKRFPIDRLPPNIKGMALRRMREWLGMAEEFPRKIDDVLRAIAYSPILDRDPEKEKRAEERAAQQKAKQKQFDALYPGESWRAPRRKK